MQLPLPGSANSPPKASVRGGGHLRVILRGRRREREDQARVIKAERSGRDGDSGYSPDS